MPDAIPERAFFVPILREDFMIKPPAFGRDKLYAKELMNLNLIFIQIHVKDTIVMGANPNIFC